VCILTVVALDSSAALGANTGGAVASPTSSPATPATPAKPLIHLDPVTAKTPKLTYNGPVYEKNAAGEVVPYQPTLVTAPTTGGQLNPTGGSPVGATASSTTTTSGPSTKPELLVPGALARYVDGQAAAPMSVPAAVQEIIWAGNDLIGLPYIFGGGHASFISPGYDCSGTVSFALHGANLLSSPEDSGEFESWGSHGAGRYVTIFANGGHAYMTVAGLRLDTSAANDPSGLQGPRWRPLRPANEGFVVRHPLGL